VLLVIKSKIKNFIIDSLYYILGSIIYSIAIPMFISPAHISPGGFTGVALIFNYLFLLPSGLLIFLFNIPVFLIGYKKIGRIFILKTAVVTFLISLFLDISEKYIKAFTGDKILCAVFGGIFIGLGLGIILLRGATTGGVDIIAKLINAKKPHVSIGRIILISDIIVVSLSVICYRDFSGALYSVITIYITSIVLDGVLYGGNKGKLIFVVSKMGEKISENILKTVNRGVTVLTGVGAYTGEDKKVLMCAVRRQEIAVFYSAVKSVDENAFIIVCDAGEIEGNGFKK
jgi:uncharacterized membrane-anchored protein YitT (DUF2179 family)